MSSILRFLLFMVSIFTFLYIVRKLRKEQLQILDTLFWFVFIVVILLMSIFPKGVMFLTEIIGVQSSVNFVFLVIIFFLFIRCFLLTIRVYRLENNFQRFVEEYAVRKNIEESMSK